MDSFPGFPHRSAVHPGTWTCLTSKFEMGLGKPRRYDRPGKQKKALFIKLTVQEEFVCLILKL